MGTVNNGIYRSDYSGDQIDDLLKRKRNWIRNGYFVGTGTAGDFPINQKGQSSYSNAGLTIDGWTLQGSQSLTVNASDGGIKLAKVSSPPGLRQIIANGEKLAGKKITLSMLCVISYYSKSAKVSLFSNGSQINSIAYDASPIYGTPAVIRIMFKTFDVPAGTTQLAVSIDYGQLLAVKIEEGTASTISEDVPDYVEELRRCQRYYYKRHYSSGQTIGLGMVQADWGVACVSIGVPVEMASDVVSCAVTPTSGIGISGPGVFTGGTPASGGIISGTTLLLQMTGASAATSGVFYAYANGGVDIELTAS